MRIGIVGTAGTGKSDLGKKLAERLEVSFLPSKHITNEILDRDGYDYASNIQIERFLAHGERQREILGKTIELHKADGFVTDRTFADLASYAICELHDSDTHTIREIVAECNKNMSVYSHVFVCPWLDLPLRDNKRRTLNPWYQFVIHSIEISILDQWGVTYHVLENEDSDGRVDEILSLLS
jgi:hypothetical protein